MNAKKRPAREDVPDSRQAKKRRFWGNRFSATICSDADVVALAASFHPSKQEPEYFRKPQGGGFNQCFFVEFSTPKRGAPKDRWVIRVPMQNRLESGLREKMQKEIATMRCAQPMPVCYDDWLTVLTRQFSLIAERTTIPIPKIIASGIGDESQPVPTFIILEYVEGISLSDVRLSHFAAGPKKQFYESLADIYVQLRRLEFSSIGCLNDKPDPSMEGPTKMAFNLKIQDLDYSGKDPGKIIDKYITSKATIQSATDYANMMLDIADEGTKERLEKIPSKGKKHRELLRGHALRDIERVHAFRKCVLEWLKPELDKGPFVLAHGDVRPPNIILDETAKIAALLDWEWSAVVPAQCLAPPLWLKHGQEMMAQPEHYATAMEEYGVFIDVVRSRERALFPSDEVSLADEWEAAKPDGGFFIPHALDNWYLATSFRHDKPLPQESERKED